MCLYSIGIMYPSGFSVIDDHTLLHTLFADKPIGFFIQPSIGRFYPLDGQDLNILSLLFGTSASVFYAFNALCVWVVIFALRYALRVFLREITESADINSSKIYYVVDILLLSPAFIGSWLRLFVPERMEFVFLSLFLMCYAFVLGNHRKIYVNIALISGALCANSNVL